MLPYPLRQLRDACDTAPLTPKILFVPSRRVGHLLTGSLARHGVTWTHLRVTTPVALAYEWTQVEIAVTGGHRPTIDEQWMLAGDVVTTHADEVKACYGTLTASTSQVLLQTLIDLRLAGVTPSQLRTAGKGQEPLSILLDAYEQRLMVMGGWDDAQILDRAAQTATTSPPKTDQQYFILDETEMTVRDEAFLRALAGGSIQRIGRMDYGIDVPTRWAHHQLSQHSIPGHDASYRVAPEAPAPMPRSALIQGDLFLDALLDQRQPSPRLHQTTEVEVEIEPAGRLLTTGLQEQEADRLRLWQATGHESEVRAVLRDVLDHGLVFDDVEIAFPTTHDTYLPLLYDAVSRLDLPVDFTCGVPITLTRAGRCLRAFLDWISEGLDGHVLIAALRAGDIAWTPKQVTVAEVTSWLHQGRVDRGRDTLSQSLRRVAATRSGKAKDLHDRLKMAEEHLQMLVDFVPAETEITLSELACCARQFLQAMAPANQTETEEETDPHGAVQMLCRRLSDIGSVTTTQKAPQARQSQCLAERLLSLRIDAREPCPGRISIAPIAQSGYSHRTHLYILGLAESHFPSPVSPDPAVDDEDRARWSMPQRRERSQGDTAHLIRLLGVAHHVTLSAHRLVLADGREPFPTPLFSQVARQTQIRPLWQRPMAQRGLGCDDLESMLGQRSRHAYSDMVAAAYPNASAGFAASRARGRGVTRFDGWIGADVDAFSTIDVWSARMLETLAQCPRRWLWQDGLRLNLPDDAPRDPRRWIQPMEMGLLLHEVFADFMRYLRERNEIPRADHASILTSITDTALERMQAQIPVTLHTAFNADRQHIERAIAVFLQAEAERFEATEKRHVMEVERQFGDPDDPVMIQIGARPISLRGRIDRIDHVSDSDTSQVEIWDYKTGSTFGFDQSDLLAGGRRLQWVLYAMAAEQFLPDNSTVTKSGYFFTSDRGAGQRFAAAPLTRSDLERVLGPLIELGDRGLFPSVHKAGASQPCRFCDFRRICASEALDGRGLTDRRQTMEQWTGLVEGWAQTKTAGRQQASQVIEARLAEAGVSVSDVGPADAVDAIEAWINS